MTFGTETIKRVCSPDELESLTRQGWRVVDKVQRAHVVDVPRTHVGFVPPQYEPQRGGYFVEPPNGKWHEYATSEQVVVPETHFLLELNEASSLAKLTGELNVAHAAAEKDRANTKEACDQLIKALENQKQLETRLAEANKLCQAALAAYNMTRSQLVKLERDFAILKNAIGDLRAKEILQS